MLTSKQFYNRNLSSVCEFECRNCEYKKFTGDGYTCSHEDEEDKCSIILNTLDEWWEDYQTNFGEEE